MDKTPFRKAAFAARKVAHGQGSDAQANDILRNELQVFHGASVAGYMPIRTEIDPLATMTAYQGIISVPVIQGAAMPLKFARWTPNDTMVDGPFGAKVPARLEYVEPEVLIVPLVGFDRAGNRLGYGGGFYDRTLEILRAKRPTVAIGFAYAAQELDDLPIEPTDQPLDMIVTERGVLRF